MRFSVMRGGLSVKEETFEEIEDQKVDSQISRTMTDNEDDFWSVCRYQSEQIV